MVMTKYEFNSRHADNLLNDVFIHLFELKASDRKELFYSCAKNICESISVKVASPREFGFYLVSREQCVHSYHMSFSNEDLTAQELDELFAELETCCTSGRPTAYYVTTKWEGSSGAGYSVVSFDTKRPADCFFIESESKLVVATVLGEY